VKAASNLGGSGLSAELASSMPARGQLIVESDVKGGPHRHARLISNTAEYGDYVSGPRLITAEHQGGDAAHSLLNPGRALREEFRGRMRGRQPAMTAPASVNSQLPIEQCRQGLRLDVQLAQDHLIRIRAHPACSPGLPSRGNACSDR